MNDCLFCSIAEKKTPAFILHEDEQTMALLDIYPSVEGHGMVILKKHGESILEYSPEELGALMATVQKIAKAIEKAFNTDAITIGINHMEKKGIHHLHVHLIPRFDDDMGHPVQGVVKKLSDKKFEDTASKIKEAL